MLPQDLLDTWRIHQHHNLQLLQGIPQEYLGAVSASKGRTVGAQWAHIHQVRMMWLQAAMPDLLAGLRKIEKEEISSALLAEQLQASAGAIAKLLENGLETGRIKGFKPHPTAFLGYLIAHESHHRGQIILSLKQSGYALDKKLLFSLWEWNK